jgi:hypothetical protein
MVHPLMIFSQIENGYFYQLYYVNILDKDLVTILFCANVYLSDSIYIVVSCVNRFSSLEMLEFRS